MSIQPGRLCVYNGRIRMIYGVYNNGVSLTLDDYLDTESDEVVSLNDIELLNNYEYYVLEVGNHQDDSIRYITAGDSDTAIEIADEMRDEEDIIYSCTHASMFLLSNDKE